MKLLRKILKVLSYIWVMAMDLLILLSVSTMFMNTAITIGMTNQLAFGVGVLVAAVAFAHLKFRHVMRRADAKPVIVIRPIHNEADHKRALEQIDCLWGAKSNSPDSEKLEILMILVDDWEREYFRGLMQKDSDVVQAIEQEEHPVNFIKHGEEPHE